jgi:hypothetical protein
VRFIVKSAGLAALLVAACQSPDEYFRGPFDAGGGVAGSTVTGLGGAATGTGGNGPGAGGMPTGLGGTGPGAAGSTGAAGAIGSAGSGGSPSGTAGSGTTGAAGTASGRGGTTGTAGTTATGRGGTTGAAGNTGAAGATARGGATGTAGAGAAGTTGTGRGGTTGAAGSATAGTTGAGGTSSARGGTTGTAGTGGTATVLYSDDFENEAVGETSVNGWSRMGGSSGDWAIATDGTKVLEQSGSTSSTVRAQAVTGASGSPWSGALTASARVKMISAGSSNQAALLCVRFNAISDRYCGALVPGGVQILTAVGGTAGGSAVFSASVTTGTFYTLRVSVDASNVLTVFLDGAQKGTYTPAAMTNGTVAVGTASMEAAFDDISVTRP